jgi:hypothetical protein
MLNNSDLFVEKSLQFHNENINLEQIPIPISDAKFGILKLSAISAPLSQEEQEFIFMVDCSGSMSDKCSDGRDKMQHIVHTLKNMILYFKENSSIKVYITINAFDDIIYKIVDRTDITHDNIDSIIQKVNAIFPRNSTNIEGALKSINQTIEEIKSQYPTHNICNIFMTDGQATCGNQDINYLSGLVDRNITNAFIGFGIEHDSVLLNSMGNGKNSGYHFIDKLENAGIVYGEILHEILYKLLSNVSISVTNGLIYDYKNNLWTDSINIDKIVSESEKFYHIASSTPEQCHILLKSQQNVEHDSTMNYEFSIFKSEECGDLTKYVFRQRTLQLLYKVNEFSQEKNGVNNGDVFSFTSRHNEMRENEEKLKSCLKKFIKEMKTYMKDNNIENDKIMKNLCDDIYICYRMIGTRFGAMYTAARQNSQGTQRCYAVNHTPDDVTENINSSRSIGNRNLPPPRLVRQTNQVGTNITFADTDPGVFGLRDSTPYSNNNSNNSNNSNNNSNSNSNSNSDDEFDDIEHVLSNFADAPYSTPGATQLMKTISGGTTECDVFSQSTNDII